MKKSAALAFMALFLIPVCASAATTVTVDDSANTVTVSPGQPAAVQTAVVAASPVIVERDGMPKEFEGEIIQVDYPGSQITVHDTDGRDRRVLVKDGMIKYYKVDDYVQVSMMADLKEAKMIHTVQNASRYEGTIVAVDTAAETIVVRDSSQSDRTVILAPGMSSHFKTGERVRIYLVPDHREARFVRIV